MKNKIEENILKKIKNGEVKMKPKWWFVAELWGIKIINWVVLLVGSLGAMLLFHFFDLYRPTELSEWVQLGGWGLLWEDFPIWGLTGFISCLIIGVILLENVGDNYRKPNYYWMFLTTAIIICMGIVLFLLKIGI